jgi:hypothetical protein
MKTQKIVAFIVSCLLCAPLAAADRQAYPLDVQAEGVQKILFDVQEGNFILRGAPDAKHIHMMVSIDRMWIFKLGEQDLLHRLIKISGEGTPEVTIKTDIPRGITSFGRAAYPIDFEVVVPESANLEIRDTSGKIEVTEMKGKVAIEDGSGTVALHDLSGALTLRKKSGDVKMSDISGVATIESETGQMDIRRMGRLDIRDASSAQVRSRGGNLKISDVKGNLGVDDQSGEIVINRVHGEVDIRDTSGQIRTADTGPLSIRDTSGDITVRRAASLNVIEKESGRIAAGEITGNITVPAGFKISRIR